MSLQKKNGVLNRLFMGLVFLFLYAPIFLLIVFSFNAGNSSVVWKGFSLHWYAELFQDRLIMQSISTTLMTVNSIPMMNADIVTGVSLCLLFVAVFGLWNGFAEHYRLTFSLFGTVYRITFPRLTLGFGTLLIAHISFNIPYVILSVGPKLRQMDKNLVDAAQDLGCTWFQAFWKVILPEIMPGIVSGALIAFTMSVDDFVISYFTAGSATSTLAMAIYGMTKKRVSPEINAVSTLLFVTVLVLLVIVNVREARAEKAAAAQRFD